MDKNVNFSMSSKVLAAAALGAGIIVGAGTAYIISRIHDHSNLTHLVAHLHNTVIEVKEEIAHLETELGLGQRLELLTKEKCRTRNRKAVSFRSNTTSTSYKTACGPLGVLSDRSSYRTPREALTDADSWKSPLSNESDYLSPEEDDDDDDEFFDIVPSDGEGDEIPKPPPVSKPNDYREDNIAVEVSELTYLIREIDSMVDKSAKEQEEAYHLLMAKSSKYKHNSEILWRMARATRNMASIAEVNGDPQARRAYMDEAYGYAEKALKINDKSAEIHKWYAITAGGRGEYLSTKERIESGHVFKEHIDIALQLSPNDAALHHLLGRFCYEVSLLTWVEKKVAAAIFGKVPESSYEEALHHFEAADKLDGKGWKENTYFIAKCYLKLNNHEEGVKYLGHALHLPTLTPDDEIINHEIEHQMKKYHIDTSELSSSD